MCCWRVLTSCQSDFVLVFCTWYGFTLLGTNISPVKVLGKISFLFHRMGHVIVPRKLVSCFSSEIDIFDVGTFDRLMEGEVENPHKN